MGRDGETLNLIEPLLGLLRARGDALGYGTLRANHPDLPWAAAEQAWLEAIVRRPARISGREDGSS